MNRRHFFKTVTSVGTCAMAFNIAQARLDPISTEPYYMNITLPVIKPIEVSITEPERRLPVIIDIFLRHQKAFANFETATQIGIRETRTIRGLYTLTADDILSAHPFSDSVALGGHPIDIHREDSSQNVRFLSAPYHIPYRTLVPKGSNNVLVAGGTLSSTSEAFGSVRVQAQCMALGQAAGVAAAICVQKGCNVSMLDGTELSARLKAEGALV